jgi:flagellar hook protein FlgE
MSFQQALSGLNASSKNLEVIGNNIANANTYGAKASRAEFADMFATSLTGASGKSAGIGVNLAAVAQQFSQGNISTTTNSMDLAVNGRGFFQVLSDTGSIDYTRNGQFKLDRDGYVVNDAGLKLLAQPWNEAAGRADGDAAPIKLQSTLGKAVATGSGTDPDLKGARMAINLKATDAVKTAQIDFATASTYNYATSQTVYDAEGAPLSMTYYFKKTSEAPNPQTWEVYATLPQTDATTGTVTAAKFDGSSGTGLLTTLTFDTNGKLVDTVPPTTTQFPKDVLDPRDATSATTLFTQLPFDFTGTTQFAANYSISELKQDGYAAGEMTGIQFDASGVVTANYSNGRSSNLGQVQLADFTNLQGLQPLGGNLWASSFSSGEPTRGAPSTGTLGSLQASALEESNIDLTAELVNMITAQRIYQANAQTIKTEDQIMQTLVNLR